MPDQTYQLPRDSTMQGIVTQLQNIASRMNNSGSGSGGSGGGSTVVANPSGTAEADLSSVEIDGVIYDIPNGGTTYDDTALRALIAAKQDALTPGTGIQISNGTISCTVQGGSGSGGVVAEETVLYTNSGTSRESFTLSDDYTNYDQLKIIVERNNSGTIIESPANLYDTLEIANAASIQVYWFGSEYAAFSVPTTDSKTTFTLLGGDGIGYIKKVIGIKYGSGSGSGSGGTSSEVIPIEAGDGTSSRTFTFTRKPKLVHVWFTVPEKWSMSEDIFWGQPWGVYNCTNGNAPYSSGAQGSNTIVFDDNNLTMTITGINALGCANNSNGYGYMWVEYGEGGAVSVSEGTLRTVDLIYEATNDSPPATITLDDPYIDYDYLVFEFNDTGNTGYKIQTINVLKEEMDRAISESKAVSYFQSGDSYIIYNVTDSTTLSRRAYQNLYINKIYGVKEGSGGSSPQEEYSTTEKVVGKWIDGRDIYQITIGDETSPVSQQDLSSLNIDFTIDIDGIFGDSNLGLSQCTYTTTASSTVTLETGYVTYTKSTHMLTVVNSNGYVYCVTLKYVKSTD